MSKNNAESAMKAAWFVPNSIEGKAIENKDKWGTIYSQSLQPEGKFAEADKKVTLRFYKKPEKKKQSSIHPLVGVWEGYTIDNRRTDGKNKRNRYIKIQSVDHNGNFKGFYISGEKNKYQVLGTVNGNKIFLHSSMYLSEAKYEGILNTQQMTIKGKWSFSNIMLRSRAGESGWRQNVGPFYLKKSNTCLIVYRTSLPQTS